MTFLLAPRRKRVNFCIESCMYVHNTLLACLFGQLFFLGLSKCLPKPDFYLPRAIGKVLMQHPAQVLLKSGYYKQVVWDFAAISLVQNLQQRGCKFHSNTIFRIIQFCCTGVFFCEYCYIVPGAFINFHVIHSPQPCKFS